MRRSRRWYGYAGLMQVGHNPITGGMNSLYRASEAGLDPSGGPYATVCETHGTICNHRTFELAISHVRGVPGWCEPCNREPVPQLDRTILQHVANAGSSILEAHADELNTCQKAEAAAVYRGASTMLQQCVRAYFILSNLRRMKLDVTQANDLVVETDAILPEIHKFLDALERGEKADPI